MGENQGWVKEERKQPGSGVTARLGVLEEGLD